MGSERCCSIHVTVAAIKTYGTCTGGLWDLQLADPLSMGQGWQRWRPPRMTARGLTSGGLGISALCGRILVCELRWLSSWRRENLVAAGMISVGGSTYYWFGCSDDHQLQVEAIAITSPQ